MISEDLSNLVSVPLDHLGSKTQREVRTISAVSEENKVCYNSKHKLTFSFFIISCSLSIFDFRYAIQLFLHISIDGTHSDRFGTNSTVISL